MAAVTCKVVAQPNLTGKTTMALARVQLRCLEQRARLRALEVARVEIEKAIRPLIVKHDLSAAECRKLLKAIASN